MVTDEATSRQFNVDNVWTVASVVIGSGIALLPLFLSPLLVGEYIAALQVSDSNAGLIMSVEMTGFTIGAGLLFVMLTKNWRWIVCLALALMAIGNLLSPLAGELSFFVVCRFFSGLGAGMLMTMTIQVIALMRDPDRIYGLWTVGQLVLGALGIFVFPRILAEYSIHAVFVIWAVLVVSLLASVRFYPIARAHNSEAGVNKLFSRRFSLGLLALLGLFIYYSGQAGVWMYMERVGAAWNLAPEMVANTLFLSLLSGIAGSALAIVFGTLIGRTLPLAASMTISAISIWLLLEPRSSATFILAACLFNFGWYLFLPYISALIAAVDETGKLLTALSVAFPAGLAAGPTVAALLIGDAGILIPALIFGLISVPIGLVLIVPASRLKFTDTSTV